MAILGGAAAGTARQPRPAATDEPGDRVADRALVVVDDRIAAGRLVGGKAQRVQRQRIRIGRRALLLDQRPQDAQLSGVGFGQSWITTAEPTTRPARGVAGVNRRRRRSASGWRRSSRPTTERPRFACPPPPSPARGVRQPEARSTSANATSRIPSSAAGLTRSLGWCFRSVRFARFSTSSPRARGASGPPPPPLVAGRGSYPHSRRAPKA